MEVADFFTQLFAQVFRVLELNMPFFNIPIWSVWVGIFLIGVSIRVFRNFIAPESVSGLSESRRGKRYERKGDE